MSGESVSELSAGAEADAAYQPRIHEAVVARVVRLNEGMVRVTFAGEDLRDYPTTGIGDEYVRLFFPDTPEEDVRMPVISERGWDYPEGVEPGEMRTYTIRAHRQGEVDIDFVVHEGGIAAAWATQAKPGQRLGINPPHALYDRPARASRQVLVADEPALPAALRIVELTAGLVETHVIAEVRGREYRLEASAPAGVTHPIRYTWLDGSGNSHAPSRLVEALGEATLDDETYVWVATETRVSRDARRHLRHERKLPRDGYKTIGYWIDHAEEWRARYDAQGESFHQQVEAIYASKAKDEEQIEDDVVRLYESVGL